MSLNQKNKNDSPSVAEVIRESHAATPTKTTPPPFAKKKKEVYFEVQIQRLE